MLKNYAREGMMNSMDKKRAKRRKQERQEERSIAQLLTETLIPPSSCPKCRGTSNPLMSVDSGKYYHCPQCQTLYKINQADDVEIITIDEVLSVIEHTKFDIGIDDENVMIKPEWKN